MSAVGKNLSTARPHGWLLSVFAALAVLFTGLLIAPMSALAATGGGENEEDAPQSGGSGSNVGDLELPFAADEDAVPEVSSLSRAISPRAASDIIGPVDAGPLWGYGFQWFANVGGNAQHWLGPQLASGQVEWCINFDSQSPTGSATSRGVSPRPLSSDGAVAAMQVTSNEQMGYILEKWGDLPLEQVGGANKAVHNAAVSVVVHMSYEEGGGLAYLDDLARDLEGTENGRLIARWSRMMVEEAKANAGVPGGSAELNVSENRQDFTIDKIGVQQQPNNNWLGGVPVTVTITSGNGVFEATQTNGSVSADGLKWTGATTTSPLSLKGHSTANGDIKTTIQFKSVNMASVQGFDRPNGTQSTVAFKKSATDPKVEAGPEPIVRDFQPVAVSNVGESRIVAPGVKSISDTLTVSVKDSEAWLGALRTYPGTVGYAPLEVKFAGTAYYTGTKPPVAAASIPSGAVAVATAEILADGPGDYTATANIDSAKMPGGGFVTWVWEMNRADQTQIPEDQRYMIRGDWSDGYGSANETSVRQWDGKIETNVKINPTNDNTYLVDDVWISGLPEDYPDFAGNGEFGADTKTITQSLYFWEGVTDGSTLKSVDDAVLIGSTTLPAKNGFYASVGGTQFKIVRDAAGEPVKGTYQFVHDFAGSDRVAAFQSPIPDAFEQYTVYGTPQIGTTATGLVDSMLPAQEDVTITDKVCYLNLIPGKEYELQGVLMDQSTGKALLVDGKEVSASKKFTPESSEGCVDLEFTFNAKALAGTTTVVFEDLFVEGVKIATHADLEDEGQTVYIPKVGTTATGPDGGKEITPGKESVVTDKVCYENLVPGKEYTISGVLMDKKTEKPLVVNGKEVTASKTFTAKDAKGCEDLQFKFDSTALAGKSLVVFEDLLREDVKVATHADINDKGQTVKVVPTGTLPKTGAAGTAVLLTLGLGSLLGGGYLVWRRNRGETQGA